MWRAGLPYKEVWCHDFEFSAPPGERPTVVCLVAKEIISGREIRIWQDEMPATPPYDIGPDSLFVAFYASAEVGCHLALGWSLPVNMLDLYTEFRNLTNGLYLVAGKGLLGAQAYFDLPSIDATEKGAMRELAQKGQWTATEIQELLNYCASDVYALEQLLPLILSSINLQQALLRGRYMCAAASIEHAGIPIDVAMLSKLQSQWPTLQSALIEEVDKEYGVFDGTTFKVAKFETFLIARCIPWPRLLSGKLDLQDDTFKSMALSFPVLGPLRELRKTLSQMRQVAFPVGADGRNRCLISAFSSRTGRNQPSTSQFIFGASSWVRSLIKPQEGLALAYIDYSQQEFGIAAALSGDELMQQAYLSGDPYLEFAKQAGAVPIGATKQTHKLEREQFKACVLAVQYGMGAESLAVRINQPVVRAKELLSLHRATYAKYWHWSEGAVDYAMLYNKLWTVFGWHIHVFGSPNPRFLQNFPMQANGAEMLRLACTLVTEAGITICAPVHDAILIEATIENIDDAVARTQTLMAIASEQVLGGKFRLRSDAEIIRVPDRYSDERGAAMWATVCMLLNGPPA